MGIVGNVVILEIIPCPARRKVVFDLGSQLHKFAELGQEGLLIVLCYSFPEWSRNLRSIELDEGTSELRHSVDDHPTLAHCTDFVKDAAKIRLNLRALGTPDSRELVHDGRS